MRYHHIVLEMHGFRIPKSNEFEAFFEVRDLRHGYIFHISQLLILVHACVLLHNSLKLILSACVLTMEINFTLMLHCSVVASAVLKGVLMGKERGARLLEV